MADEGYPGVAVSLGRDFRTSRFDADANRFCAGAGVLLSSVVQDAFHRSLAGLEFAVGTPGTIGGALRMNAGSRDEWLGARVASVTTYAPETGLVRRAGAEIAWGYRTSSFAPHDVLVECELAVEPADPFFIRGKMEASLARRKKTQPLTEPSCGSVFKNPEGASGRGAHRTGRPQGRAPWRRPGVGGACELHREHGRCHGGRRLRAHRTHTDEGARGPWRRTLARSTVPRVRVGRRPPVAALRPRAPLAAPPRLPAAHLPPAVPARRVGARGEMHARPTLRPTGPFPEAAPIVGRSQRARGPRGAPPRRTRRPACRRCAWATWTARRATTAPARPTGATSSAWPYWPPSC